MQAPHHTAAVVYSGERPHREQISNSNMGRRETAKTGGAGVGVEVGVGVGVGVRVGVGVGVWVWVGVWVRVGVGVGIGLGVWRHALVLVSVGHSESGVEDRVHNAPGHEAGHRGIDGITMCHNQHIVSLCLIGNILHAMQSRNQDCVGNAEYLLQRQF